MGEGLSSTHLSYLLVLPTGKAGRWLQQRKAVERQAALGPPGAGLAARELRGADLLRTWSVVPAAVEAKILDGLVARSNTATVTHFVGGAERVGRMSRAGLPALGVLVMGPVHVV